MREYKWWKVMSEYCCRWWSSKCLVGKRACMRACARARVCVYVCVCLCSCLRHKQTNNKRVFTHR